VCLCVCVRVCVCVCDRLTPNLVQTILHVNSLFPYSVPPVVSFALGSLGFLTPFDVAEFEHHLACVIRGEFCLTVRQRLEAQIFKLSPTGEFIGSPSTSTHTTPNTHTHTHLRRVVCDRTAYQCMNEVVIDRGPDSHLCSLECYCDGLLITTIQADGVIISSTTGSTAYSLSAGGTMCHPIVPAVCFTPICPHSLSCRPIMFPDSVTLRIQVCDAPHAPHCTHRAHSAHRTHNSILISAAGAGGRAHARVGVVRRPHAHRTQLARVRGHQNISMAHPMYASYGTTHTTHTHTTHNGLCISRACTGINKTDHIGDWFRSLCECLNWNNRQKQKAFPPPT
jgi:NAD kinase